MQAHSRIYSQNFLINTQVISQIVKLANLNFTNTVVDIGAGKGGLTGELVKKASKVIAIEIDPKLVQVLHQKFKNNPKVEIIHNDIRQYLLPQLPYKVFSNIPFHITADVIYKLLYYSQPPTQAYLIVQKEAAQKFMGNPIPTQFSLIAYPWFNFEIIYNFKSTDFFPVPTVPIVLLKITKRISPLLEQSTELEYKNFIKYAFNHQRKNLKKGLQILITYNQWKRLAKENNFNLNASLKTLNPQQWLILFKFLHKLKYR